MSASHARPQNCNMGVGGVQGARMVARQGVPHAHGIFCNLHGCQDGNRCGGTESGEKRFSPGNPCGKVLGWPHLERIPSMPVDADEQVGVFVTPPSALPQLVPSRTCLQCDVCCRFPDPDSSLRPYFTG